VRAPQTFDAWIAKPAEGVRLLLAEPSAAAGIREVHDIAQPSVADLLVGPEGGWSERELRAAEASGAQLVTLGHLTLRADAVPLVALTALRTVWRDL
jgi:16S rRNA (uracil1498-N3)-methyltransferase